MRYVKPYILNGIHAHYILVNTPLKWSLDKQSIWISGVRISEGLLYRRKHAAPTGIVSRQDDTLIEAHYYESFPNLHTLL